MHGVGADNDKIGSSLLQALGGLSQDIPALLPVPAGLAGFNFMKINTV